MPAYALHTDPAAYGYPARYAVLRYPSASARDAALKRFTDGQDAARRIRAEGHIIPACLPTPFETVEPVAESVAARICYAAARVYNTGFIDWAYTRYADADAALYFN